MANEMSHSFTNLHLVEQMQKLTVPRQRALISMIAICEKHDLPADEILASFSNDLPRTPLEDRRRTRKFFWSRVQNLADESLADDSNSTFEKAAGHVGLLPDFANVAMRIQRENGTQGKFNEAWLRRSPDYLHDQSQSKSLFAQIVMLSLKVAFVLFVITFVMIRIIPELKEMMEEFGIEALVVFEMTIAFFDSLVKVWFVPFFLLLFLIPLFCMSAVRYLRRWNPFTWLRRERSRANKNRELLALQLIHGRDLNFDQSLENQFDYQFAEGQPVYNQTESQPKPENLTGAREIDWKKVQSNWKISKREVRLLATAGSSDVQGWLLSRSAVRRGRQDRSRSEFYTRFAVTTVNIIIGIFVFALAVTIISTLISVMANFQ